MRTILFLGLICISCTAISQPDAEILFQQAQAKYAEESYAEARDLVQQALEMAPEDSSYYHLLGKCYGRLAQQANWLKAPFLASKTRKAFEKAVALDDRNVLALRDLMEYYREAPAPLGGSQTKADKIAARLASQDMINQEY